MHGKIEIFVDRINKKKRKKELGARDHDTSQEGEDITKAEAAFGEALKGFARCQLATDCHPCTRRRRRRRRPVHCQVKRAVRERADHCTDKLFNSFILWYATTAVCAVDIYDVSSTVLGASTISSFLGLRKVLVSKLVILFTVVSEYTLVFISIII